MVKPRLSTMPSSKSAPLSKAPLEVDEQSLKQAQAAFKRGDYRHARSFALKLQESSDPKVQEEASALLAQLRPSRLSLYLYALTLLILCMVTLYSYIQ